ncbi:unnamed protein product [Parascedosporium putredinis]|uniref:Protoheme IX farnesyltransferase, mitochondrial n=1 Tax=Parascedosporium putredinis TaxID=1442378 RepID=A0A9P1M8U4_9PEZI|nr:unnamed protein product [Parascedosporium putredinis]CAI7994282.1 unnamed protein product [Parascedosporium putredinis]
MLRPVTTAPSLRPLSARRALQVVVRSQCRDAYIPHPFAKPQHAAQQPANSFRRIFSSYLSLAKPRLSALVVLTAMAPYALYPPLTLLFLTTGTALCAASANSLNMLYEATTDAVMSRTRNRPLVRRLVSRPGALLFALLTATGGVAALYFGVNPTVSFLGATNVVLYAGIYTPLKALHPINTWIVPHFMALSWTIREDYKAAGLRMLAWTNPARNARVALRYSLLFAPICFALCAAGVTECVWQLPAILVLAVMQKKGMWSRVWKSIVGDHQDVDEDGYYLDYEDELVDISSEEKTHAAVAKSRNA